MPDEKFSPGIFRYVLGVEYRGTHYCGWQRQEKRGEPVKNPSVQSELESALAYVADESIAVTCAGRTDKGVHACEQVIHFETQAQRPLKAWVLGVNSKLPDDVSVLWAKQVNDEFNARFSATARTYRYVIDNRPQRPAITQELMTWVKQPLNTQAMHNAAQFLLGENDFTSFRAAACQSKTPFRYVEFVKVISGENRIVMEIKANAFLHHMVRNIVGSLLEVGKGEKPIVWIKELLAVKDRNQAGKTSPPQGLYLLKVDYPKVYALPGR